MSDSPAEHARTWLRAWDTQNLSLLRLAPDFVHTSPFGRIEGAEEYLRIVEPMSKKSVRAITVRDVLERRRTSGDHVRGGDPGGNRRGV